MTIYDEFVKDDEWNRLNALYHMNDLTYRERDALRGALDNREALIRKQSSEKFTQLCNDYKEKHKND